MIIISVLASAYVILGASLNNFVDPYDYYYEYKSSTITEEIAKSSNDDKDNLTYNNSYTMIGDFSSSSMITHDYEFLTQEDYQSYLNKYPGLSNIGLAEVLYDSAHKGVNPFLILAIVRLESGNGTSDLAKYNNNYGGIRSGGYYQSYKSAKDGLNDIVDLIYYNYLSSDGSNYNGVRVKDISIEYCNSDSEWINQILSMMTHSEKYICSNYT